MDKMRLYGSGRNFARGGNTHRLGIWAVLCCVAVVGTGNAAASNSLFHYEHGGFSPHVSLRTFGKSAPQPRSQTNSQPQAVSRVVTAPANADTLITLSATNTHEGSSIFFVTSLPASGKLYQYTSQGRGSVIRPGAAVTDMRHRVVFAPAANGFGAPYSHFDFVANDRKGISDPAAVTVNVPPIGQPRFVDIKRRANGRCQLLFKGPAYTAYRISASSDLITWQDIGVPAQAALELFAYEDKDASQFSARFYRIRISDTAPQPELTAIERQNHGNCIVRFSGGPYWPHSVWVSSDLLEWRRLGEAQETAPGRFQFIDALASSMSHRFYRVSSP